jgi:hypothetical protein
MAGQLIKAIMSVAPHRDKFGIRIRLTRVSNGIWLGEGWGGPSNAKDAHEAGAEATPEGWMWPDAESAEAHMNEITNSAHSFGYEEIK